jgi:hypothetical protein
LKGRLHGQVENPTQGGSQGRRQSKAREKNGQGPQDRQKDHHGARATRHEAAPPHGAKGQGESPSQDDPADGQGGKEGDSADSEGSKEGPP